jgi:hypothetical protein
MRCSLGRLGFIAATLIGLAPTSGAQETIDYIVDANVAGFTLQVDGRAAAQAGPGETRVVVPLRVGTSYGLRVSRDGYATASKTIIADELGNRVSFDLRALPREAPAPAPAAEPPAGAAEPGAKIDYIIDTNVPGATVEIDGRLVTRTSNPDARAVISLQLGRTYHARVAADGFVPEERSVTADELGNRLSLTLRPVAGAAERSSGLGSGLLILLAASVVALATVVVAFLLRRRLAAGHAMAAPAQTMSGPVAFDRYRLVGTLGHGGIATIYKGVDPRGGSEVAVKILDAKWMLDPDMVQKFLSEAAALQSIQRVDPGAPVVKLLGSGREGGRIDGRPFLVLELLSGETLDVRVERAGALPEIEAVAAALQIARALDVVHRAGIVHRDLTPDNIFLVPGDVRVGARLYRSVPRVVLIDFGVARQEALTWVTTDGSIVGKPPYMSPEQCRGAKVDARSDIYALGLILYAMVAGAPPFAGRNSLDVMAAQQNAVPPPLDGRVSAPCAALITQLLAKRPEERPASARAVAARLEEHFLWLASAGTR